MVSYTQSKANTCLVSSPLWPPDDLFDHVDCCQSSMLKSAPLERDAVVVLTVMFLRAQLVNIALLTSSMLRWAGPLPSPIYTQNCNIALESLNSGCTISVPLLTLVRIAADSRDLRRTESRVVGRFDRKVSYTGSKANTYFVVNFLQQACIHVNDTSFGMACRAACPSHRRSEDRE